MSCLQFLLLYPKYYLFFFFFFQPHGKNMEQLFRGRSYTSLSSLGNEVFDMPGVISEHPSKELTGHQPVSLTPFTLYFPHPPPPFFFKNFFFSLSLFTNSATSGLRGALVLVVKNQ